MNTTNDNADACTQSVKPEQTQQGTGAGADIGARLLAIGRTSSARAARRMDDLRGVVVSDTSKADAASDAVASVLAHVRRLDKVTAAQWDTARLRRVVSLYANRAAFLSLANWAGAGLTGDNTASERFDSAFFADLQDSIKNLAAADSPRGAWDESDAAARRAVVKWVFTVGLRQFAAALPSDMRGAARASAVTQARRRCRAVGSVIFGATMASAVELAGFASLKTFAESCKGAGFFEALRAARAADITGAGHIEAARIAMRRHGLDAAAAWRQLCALPSAALFTGTASGRNVAHQGHKRGRDGTRSRLAAAHVARGRLAVQFNASVRLAAHWRDVSRKAVADNLRAFDKVFARRVTDARDAETVARFDTLAHVTGLRDALGRRTGGARMDASTVRAARGKVAHAQRGAGTVALKVGRLTRALPCAALAPAQFTTYAGA